MTMHLAFFPYTWSDIMVYNHVIQYQDTLLWPHYAVRVVH